MISGAFYSSVGKSFTVTRNLTGVTRLLFGRATNTDTVLNKSSATKTKQSKVLYILQRGLGVLGEKIFAP